MIKYFVAGIISIGILGASYYYASGTASPTTTPSPAAASEKSVQTQGAIPKEWVFTDAAEKDGIPQTNVAISIDGVATKVGTYEGHCADMAGSAWSMRDGASAGAICWFAGGGTEIAVFQENGKHVVKTAVLDEGTAEEGGVRGEMIAQLSI